MLPSSENNTGLANVVVEGLIESLKMLNGKTINKDPDDFKKFLGINFIYENIFQFEGFLLKPDSGGITADNFIKIATESIPNDDKINRLSLTTSFILSERSSNLTSTQFINIADKVLDYKTDEEIGKLVTLFHRKFSQTDSYAQDLIKLAKAIHPDNEDNQVKLLSSVIKKTNFDTIDKTKFFNQIKPVINEIKNIQNIETLARDLSTYGIIPNFPEATFLYLYKNNKNSKDDSISLGLKDKELSSCITPEGIVKLKALFGEKLNILGEDIKFNDLYNYFEVKNKTEDLFDIVNEDTKKIFAESSPVKYGRLLLKKAGERVMPIPKALPEPALPSSPLPSSPLLTSTSDNQINPTESVASNPAQSQTTQTNPQDLAFQSGNISIKADLVFVENKVGNTNEARARAEALLQSSLPLQNLQQDSSSSPATTASNCVQALASCLGR